MDIRWRMLQAVPAPDAAPARVLVLDDEQRIARFIASGLVADGYDVATVRRICAWMRMRSSSSSNENGLTM